MRLKPAPLLVIILALSVLFYYIIGHPANAATYQFTMNEEITNYNYYSGLINLLAHTTSDDKVIINYNKVNNGGHMDLATQIMRAMVTSKAIKIINVRAPIYSAASMIACYGDAVQGVNSDNFMMFHHVWRYDYHNNPTPTPKLSPASLLESEELDQCVRVGILTTKQKDLIMDNNYEVYITHGMRRTN